MQYDLNDFIFSSIIGNDDKNSIYYYNNEYDSKSKYIEYFIAYIQARMKLLSRSITYRGGIKKLNKPYDNDLFKSALIKLIQTSIGVPNSISDEITTPMDELSFDDEYITRMKLKIFETAVDFHNMTIKLNEDVQVKGKVILRNLIHSLFATKCNKDLEDLKLNCLRKLFQSFKSMLEPNEYVYAKYAIAFAIHISIPTNFIRKDDIDFNLLFKEFPESRFIDYCDYLFLPVYVNAAPLTAYINFPGALKPILYYMRYVDMRKSFYISNKAISDISLLDPQKILGNFDANNNDMAGFPKFKLTQTNLCKMMLKLYNWFNSIDSTNGVTKKCCVLMVKKDAGLIEFENTNNLKLAVASLMELTSELKRYVSLFNAILYDNEEEIVTREIQKLEMIIEKMIKKKNRYIEERTSIPVDGSIIAKNRLIVIDNNIFICDNRIKYMNNLKQTFRNILSSNVLSLLKETNLRDSLLQILNEYVTLAGREESMHNGRHVTSITNEYLRDTNPIYNILPNNSGELLNTAVIENINDDVNVYESKLNTGLAESPIYKQCDCLVNSSLLLPGHISGYCGRDSGSLFVDIETPDIDDYQDCDIPMDKFVKYFKDNLHKFLFYDKLVERNEEENAHIYKDGDEIHNIKEELSRIETRLRDASVISLNTSSFHGSSLHMYMPLNVSYEDFKSWIIRLRGILHNNSDEINFTDYIDECVYMFSLNNLRLLYTSKGHTLFRFNDSSNIDMSIKKQELLKFTFMDIERSLKEAAEKKYDDVNELMINDYMYNNMFPNMFPFFFKLFLSAVNKVEGGNSFDEPDKSKGSVILLSSNMNYHRLYIDKKQDGTDRFTNTDEKREFINNAFYKLLFVNDVKENKWISSISAACGIDEASSIDLDKLSSLGNADENENSFEKFRKNIKSFIDENIIHS